MTRRKPLPKNDPVIPQEILEQAKRSVSADRLNTKKVEKCTVCGAETTPGSPEVLCWVCKRLKVSAWRDIEQQLPAQE